MVWGFAIPGNVEDARGAVANLILRVIDSHLGILHTAKLIQE